MDDRFFATGIEAPEGPIALPDGPIYVTEMSAATSCVTRLDPAGRASVMKKTGGRPNGLALDGMIWIAEALLRAVICIDQEGREVLRIEGNVEGRFLFPDDLAFGPDWPLYVTDTGLAAEDFISGQDFVAGFMDLPWDGKIYEIDPRAGRVVRSFDRGIRFTNGIAFDAGHRLYANASLPGDVYRYDVFGPGEPRREPFGRQPRRGCRSHDQLGLRAALRASSTAAPPGTRDPSRATISAIADPDPARSPPRSSTADRRSCRPVDEVDTERTQACRATT